MAASLGGIARLIAALGSLGRAVLPMFELLKRRSDSEKSGGRSSMDDVKAPITLQSELLVKTQEQIQLLQAALEATRTALTRVGLLAAAGLIMGIASLALAILNK